MKTNVVMFDFRKTEDEIVEELFQSYLSRKDEFKELGPMQVTYRLINDSDLAKTIDHLQSLSNEEWRRREMNKPTMDRKELLSLDTKLMDLRELWTSVLYALHRKICKERKVYNPCNDWTFYKYYNEAYEFRSDFTMQGSYLIRSVYANNWAEAWDKLTKPRK